MPRIGQHCHRHQFQRIRIRAPPGPAHHVKNNLTGCSGIFIVKADLTHGRRIFMMVDFGNFARPANQWQCAAQMGRVPVIHNNRQVKGMIAINLFKIFDG